MGENMMIKIVSDNLETFDKLEKLIKNGKLQVNGDIKKCHTETLDDGRTVTVIDKFEPHSVSIVQNE